MGRGREGEGGGRGSFCCLVCQLCRDLVMRWKGGGGAFGEPKFPLGQDLAQCSNPLIRLMASKYQQECLPGMTSRFGRDNPEIHNIVAALEALRKRKKRIDLTLCSFPFCPSDFEDRESLPPLPLDFVCERCKLASYCSEECRTEHAEAHANVCECCDALKNDLSAAKFLV